MKITIWKTVFGAINPSPLFEAIAEFAQLKVDLQQRAHVSQPNKQNGFRVVGRPPTRKAL